jgi:hypothetical protein
MWKEFRTSPKTGRCVEIKADNLPALQTAAIQSPRIAISPSLGRLCCYSQDDSFECTALNCGHWLLDEGNGNYSILSSKEANLLGVDDVES